MKLAVWLFLLLLAAGLSVLVRIFPSQPSSDSNQGKHESSAAVSANPLGMCDTKGTNRILRTDAGLELDDSRNRLDDLALRQKVEDADVEVFCELIRNLPAPHRKKALNRALNLIPDSNIALLTGVLHDKSQPEEVVRKVFHDILNRAEQVKAPILRKVAADPAHPCHDDAVWILGALGETSM